ncbi:MAG: ABC transporter substrate-binding protein [Gammaproteobacteria bacterium]|nr:ABC transporter substrate-binding protein [Gammaproteobacteria bacterium]
MSQINIMALRHSAFYSPLLLTIAGGFLAAEGLEPRYTVATPSRTVPASLMDGSCDLAQSAVATSFADLERGVLLEIVHFAQINERDGFFIAGRQPNTKFTWDKLRGKRVLVDHFFQPLAMFKYALQQRGVEFSSIEAIDAGDVTAIERAFRDGKADYVHMQGPVPQQLQHEGIGHVVAAVGDVVGPVAFSSLCARRDWLQTDKAHAFMRAYRRAQAYVISAPAVEIAACEAEAGFFPDIDHAVLTATIAAYQQLGCWMADPVINRAAYERLLDVFQFSGAISRRFDYDAAIVSPPD